MHSSLSSRLAVRLGAAVTVTGMVLSFGVGSGAAAVTTPTPLPSTATAHAADLSIVGQTGADTGTVTADPAHPTPSPVNGAPLLGLLTTGALSQAAVYDPVTGNSAACAGAVGPSGVIQIGATGTCTVTGATGGVVLTLGTTIIDATAILETCSSTASGTTASLQFLNATVNGVSQGSSPIAPNTTALGAGPLATITLNNQPAIPAPASTPAGGISATGASLTLLGVAGGPPVLLGNLGTVTCGPFVAPVVPPTSVFPLKSLPIAGGTALLLAALVVPWYRRRRRTA